MIEEVWRPIPGYERYEASSQGRVRHARTLRVKRPTPNGKGYLLVCLYRGPGDPPRLHVATLVALAFHGARPGSYQVNHLDLDRTNNRPENLEWCSASENMRHSYASGTRPRLKGRTMGPYHKLKRDQIADIRRRAAAGESGARIAADFGCSSACINNVIARRSWKSVD